MNVDRQPLIDYADSCAYDVGDLKQSTNHHIHREPVFKRLFSQIQECLDEYQQLYHYSCDRIMPSLSWINKSTADEQHHIHNHPNSLLSGVYYLTDCSPTYFLNPANLGRSGVVVLSDIEDVWEYKPEAGDLIIFPSWLEHYTEPGSNRCTISFNAMPTGYANRYTLIEHYYGN